ncbi:MAG: DUF87 domain-containing protein [Fusobacteriaceae bacterium]|jgi:type IV secretion system protein VirB4|nr:DUF87 domain-containing protein [Fusobacteriaceae bacterium]
MFWRDYEKSTTDVVYREFRPKGARFYHALPWAYIEEEGIVVNKAGGFQVTFRYRGADLASSTQGELDNMSQILNNALKRLDENWAFHVEMRRSKANAYQVTKGIKEIPVFIVEKERESFFSSGVHFESDYYLTISYFPPIDNIKKLNNIFFTASAEHELKDTFMENLTEFKQEVSNIRQMLSPVFPKLSLLTSKEQIRYYHSTVSDEDHPIAVPDTKISFQMLDSYLSDCDLVTGLEPMLGERYFKVVSILNFPSDSYEGILDSLNSLNMEYRLVTRFIPLDKLTALKELNTQWKRWFGKRYSFKDSMIAAMTGKQPSNVDRDAVIKAHEIKDEMLNVQNDAISIGYYTLTAVIFDRDKDVVLKKAQTVKNVLNTAGFTAVVETYHAVEAFMGTIPGNILSNDRRPPISSFSVAHMLPTSAIWAGNVRNKHLNEPPLVYCQTTGNTPFRLNLHFGDVGHTLVFGPTGSGKSVFLELLIAQFLRYKEARVYVFDMGASSRVLAYAAGGEFYDLGENDDLAFQPLINVDDEKEREWCQEWIETLLEDQNMILDPQKKIEIWEALTGLAKYDPEKRTIKTFKFLLAGVDPKLAEGLAQYCGSGTYAKYFDGANERFRAAKFTVYEMEKLAESKNAVAPALDYLFHKLESSLTGFPTMIVLDEAWLFLTNPKFEHRISRWLKTFRKLNAFVVFATQSISDAKNSKIFSALKDNCPTKIFLPNPNAKELDQKESYVGFGLNETEISRIALSIPKRQYYFKNPEGSRLFELALSKLELCYVAASSKQDQAKAIEIKVACTKPNGTFDVDRFNSLWLDYKSLNGEIILRLTKKLMAAEDETEKKISRNSVFSVA